MTTRQLISDDGLSRLYAVFNDLGTRIGTDREPSPGTPGSNAGVLTARAQQALATNAQFLSLATPTTAQAVAQVQILTRECSALIRLALSLLDDTSGT